TLGKALITEVRAVGRVSPSAPPRHVLFQRVQFATNVNPMARIAYGLYSGNFLSAVSVGFIPLRWENADGTEHEVGRGVLTAPHPLPSDGRGIKGEGSLLSTLNHQPSTKQFRRKYLEQEL